MKILQILPYSPVRPTFGGALRMHHLLRMLVARHEVTVIAYGEEGEARQYHEEFGSGLKAVHIVPHRWANRYRRLGQVFAFWSKHSYFYSAAMSSVMQETIRRVLRDEAFDIVQTEFASMGCFSLATDAVKILDSHNIEYDNFRRVWLKTRSPFRKLHYYDEYRKFAWEEIANYRNQDALFLTSARDKELIDCSLPDMPKFVVPNGVDASYFTPSPQEPEPFSLVFTGAMSYFPNNDAAVYFLDNVFPLILREIPEAKFHIVGIQPPKELLKRNSSNVVVTGYVDDVRPYVYRSSAFVVPLRMGGGTRLKVLEAMAMRKPIVSTSIGCEGINVRQEESILIADDPETFARSVVRVLRDAELRRRLTEAGYELMKNEYEWEVIGRSVDRIYQELLARRGAPAAIPPGQGR
jgi:glycosyltransferase involved in cell wall biosynthesis